MQEFNELLAIMHKLRQECPWDKEQDLLSLRKYLLEEAYECATAMDEVASVGVGPLIEELGDVLLQIVFQAELISEMTGSDAVRKVIAGLNEKLIRRHPHVFGDAEADSTSAVLKRWDEIKMAEKSKTPSASLIDGIAKSLTGLQRAQKFGDRSKKIKFDWSQPEEVWAQFESEVKELREAKTSAEIEHEVGDLFFCLVQYARHRGVDSELALHKANQRFESRFKKMEEIAKREKKEFESYSLTEKEELWLKAKEELKN